MRKLIHTSFLVACVVASGILAAQQPPTFTRFLIPVYTADTPGAFGSVWQSRTWLHYSGSQTGTILPRAFCFGIMCPEEGALGPGEAAVPFQHLAGFPEPAILVHVETAVATQVTFSSRIRDLSRSADTAGTEVPVVREDRMPAGPVYLLNVPLDRRFRQTLRVYALPDLLDPEVRVRYFRQADDVGPRFDSGIHLLRSDTVRLRMRAASGPVNYFPALAEVGNVERYPELAGEKNIWVEVAPITPGLRIWALVSLTNNDTQEVTVISPNT